MTYTKDNNRAGGFFNHGKVLKCTVDERNIGDIKRVVASLEVGDELTLFERNEKNKAEQAERTGTPPEKQPTHNLVRVTAADAEARKAEWRASKRPTNSL